MLAEFGVRQRWQHWLTFAWPPATLAVALGVTFALKNARMHGSKAIAVGLALARHPDHRGRFSGTGVARNASGARRDVAETEGVPELPRTAGLSVTLGR